MKVIRGEWVQTGNINIISNTLKRNVESNHFAYLFLLKFLDSEPGTENDGIRTQAWQFCLGQLITSSRGQSKISQLAAEDDCWHKTILLSLTSHFSTLSIELFWLWSVMSFKLSLRNLLLMTFCQVCCWAWPGPRCGPLTTAPTSCQRRASPARTRWGYDDIDWHSHMMTWWYDDMVTWEWR